MFGYIRPLKPQMRICEYETYHAVYCGLCKQLGRAYGSFARFTLSYDFAFLSILAMALREEPPTFGQERCFAHPAKKRMCCSADDSLSFSACAAMILFYYKLDDNYHDAGLGGKLVALLAKPFAAFAYRRAKRAHPALDDVVATAMRRQYALESACCSSVDEAAAPTADMLAQLFVLLSDVEEEQRILHRLGYLLGRWVYLMDAVDDLEEDLKRGGYNAFILSLGLTAESDLPAVRKNAKAALYQTSAEAAKAYALLPIRRYQPILDNILYLGLKNSFDLIEEQRRSTHDRSL